MAYYSTRISTMPDRNIIGPKYDEETDRGMFYDEDVLEPLLPGDRSLGHLLVRLGKFSSVSDAFRNGYNKPIPTGWAQYDIGKGANRLGLTIWNPSQTREEYKAAHPEDDYPEFDVGC